MAVKPIISIAVDDAAFQKFAASFADYNAKLEAQPESWQRLNAAMEGAGEAGEALASGALSGKEALALAFAQAELISGALSKAVKAQNALGDASHGTNKKMGELAKTAKSLGSEIAGVGKWVLKLGAGALAGLGLGALLGGFGVGELASAAFNRQRTAGGLGLTPGQLASFGVNAQPFLGPGALQAAAAAQLTYKSFAPLQMLGIDFNKARGMSAADLAFEELKGAVRAWGQAQKSGLPPEASPFVQAYLQLGGDIEDVRRAALAGLPAVGAAQAGYRRDVGVLGFDKQTAAAWAAFKVQLDRAGMTLETVFIKKLRPLVPEFTKLSEWVVNAIASFVDKIGIGGIESGLEAFGNFVMKTDWKGIGTEVNLMASEIGAVADKLKWLLPHEEKPGDPRWSKQDLGLRGDAGWWGQGLQGIFGNAANSAGRAWNWAKNVPANIGNTLKSIGHDLNPLNIVSDLDSPTHRAFARYGTLAEGIRAGAALFRSYPKSYGAHTLASIIPIWNEGPEGAKRDKGASSANYVAAVELLSGVYGNKPIEKYTRAELARVIAAMSRFEGTDIVAPEQVMKALYGGESISKHTKAIVKAVRSRQMQPVTLNVTNSTSARIAVSANAAVVG